MAKGSHATFGSWEPRVCHICHLPVVLSHPRALRFQYDHATKGGPVVARRLRAEAGTPRRRRQKGSMTTYPCGRRVSHGRHEWIDGVTRRDCPGTRPLLLDLFCGAGGAARGYADAGFDVVGVDIEPQPNYPYEFVQMDALTFLRDGCWGWHEFGAPFDAIHASPPCQFATAYRRVGNVKDSPNLIPQTRALLEWTRLPYVIENVEQARTELFDPVLLCGSQFDGDGTNDIQRHRLFETNWDLWPHQWPCRHHIWAPDRYPGGRSKQRTGKSTGLVRATIEIGSWDIPLKTQQWAMGIGWMKLEELSEAIPPAYTEHIGKQILSVLKAGARAA